MTIANHYVALRQIPPTNVFGLAWNGSTDSIDVETFRERFLKPILAEIGRRNLVEQIDYIVYSSGYPYAVDFEEDLPSKPHNATGTRASLTGMTYLYQLVLARDTSYAFTITTQRNNYYQSALTRAFDSSTQWQPSGQAAAQGGRGYMLSMMLGYTDGRGNSVDEVIAYLRRAALADGTRPAGTIYLMKMDGEVRSQTRHDLFPVVATALDDVGVAVKEMNGVLPPARKDVMGVVVGRSSLDWEKSQCEILPGAICEHLTSFGGDMRATAHQTPLSVHLRHGAAGASGTVTEPYALLAKFPHPWIHVHYARGSSLAEAFYQSVASPYQLLIVGDPLCRPWARIPTVAVEGVQANQQVSGKITLRPSAEAKVRMREFQLFVDGKLIGTCRPGDTFELDTTKVSDGYHELRIVAIEQTEVASQGRAVVGVYVNNYGGYAQVELTPRIVPRDGRLRIDVQADGANSIYVFHNRRPLGRVMGDAGAVTVDTQMVGTGPVSLSVVATGTPGGKYFAAPQEILVQDSFSGMSRRFGNQE